MCGIKMLGGALGSKTGLAPMALGLAGSQLLKKKKAGGGATDSAAGASGGIVSQIQPQAAGQ